MTPNKRRYLYGAAALRAMGLYQVGPAEWLGTCRHCGKIAAVFVATAPVEPGKTVQLRCESDVFVRRFADRAQSWDEHPGDQEDTTPPPCWVDPDHPDDRLDAAFWAGIVLKQLRRARPTRPSEEPIEAAQTYAARGRLVLPCHSIRSSICTCGDTACKSPGKHPRNANGCNGASRDLGQVEQWWSRWPDANVGIATGPASGIFVVDLDPAKGGFENFARLAEQGPFDDTYTVRSGGGGLHFYWRWPDIAIHNSSSKLAPGVDIRGLGGYVVAPPSNHESGGFYTVELQAEIATAPDWLIAVLTEVPPPDKTSRPIVQMPLSRYGEAALYGAVNRIASAPDGQQRDTLNREVFAIAGLVAGRVIPSPLALESLQWAARQMSSHDPRRPWRPHDLDKLVNTAFIDGLRRPRQPEGGR